METWLCISSDYDEVHSAVCKDAKLIKAISIDKKKCSKELVPSIKQVLTQTGSNLHQLSYIGINVGPAPYTSLRIALATANGIAMSTHLPLVPIDALKVLVSTNFKNGTATVALCNAFNNELYYALTQNDGNIITGYNQALEVLNCVKQRYGHTPITFVGNGAHINRNLIVELFGPQATILNISYPSIHKLVTSGWNNWQKKRTTQQALPAYVKAIP